MTTESPTLDAIQLILLTTVSSPHASVPSSSGADVIARADRVHDVTSVLQQVGLSAEDPVKVVIRARECLAEFPAVAGNVLGRTAVVFARVRPAERWSVARTVLGTWTGGRPGVVRGGELAPGVAVYSATDPGVLVVLCDPDEVADREASARLYGPLRLAETLVHKLTAQQREYHALRGALSAARSALDAELAPYTRQVTAAQPGENAAERMLAANQRTTAAYVNLLRVVSRARRMAAMLRANRANLGGYLTAAGDGPGRRALAGRLRAAGLAVQQVQTDLADLRPLLDVAEWTSTYHCHRQLAALALTEAKENRLREADDRKRDRMMMLLTAAAAWLAFTQVWAAVVAAQPDSVRGTGWWAVGVLMFIPSLLAGLVSWGVVRGVWALARRMSGQGHS
jgi:hypothetical protein